MPAGSTLSGALGTGLAAASAVNPAMAAIGAVPELFKLGLGVSQAIRARKIEKSQQRPVYQIPGAAQQALANQQNLAMGQAPGLSTALNQMAQSQAGSLAAMQNSGGGMGERLAAMALTDRNASNAALEAGAMQEQWRAQQMGNLINEQNRFANWQERAWEYNKNKPYEEAMAKSADLRDAANENFYGAVKAGGGLIASALKGKDATGAAGKGNAGSVGRKGMMAGALGGVVAGKSPRKAFDPTNVDGQGEGPANGRVSPESLITPDPYNPGETGIQPTDNTRLTPDTPLSPSLDAMAMDRKLAAEKASFRNSLLKSVPGTRISLMPSLGNRGRRYPAPREGRYLPQLESIGRLRGGYL